jgi:hypothetical protein
MNSLPSPEATSLTSQDKTEDKVSWYYAASGLLAVVLVAAERVYALGMLQSLSGRGDAVAQSLLALFYGNPPYSLLDVILGLSIPDEPLLLVLQPRTYAIGIAQAVHFGANFLTLYAIFRLVQALPRVLWRRKWLTCGTCFGCLGMLALVVGIGVMYPHLSSSTPKTEYRPYDSAEFGVHFSYPTYIDLDAEQTKDRDSVGRLRKFTTITGGSHNPFVGIAIRIFEDPGGRADEPDSYPPSKTLFDGLIALALGDMSAIGHSDKYSDEVLSAVQMATTTRISGQPAAVYRLRIQHVEYGHMQIRGAVVISPRRDFDFLIMGCDEPEAPGSVSVEEIDRIWSEFVSSLKLDF